MTALFAASGGGAVGLGHLARSTALAQALQIRGVDVEAFVLGAEAKIEVDGLVWTPGSPSGRATADFAILDGYEIGAAEVAALGEMPRFWMHPPPEPHAADPHVDMSGEPSASGPGGIAFASLRNPYWSGAGDRDSTTEVSSILVTTGGGDAGGPVGDLAVRVRDSVPRATVRMVRGPQSTSAVPDGVDAIDAPGGLRPLLAAADIVVTAAGQTMLEALATGAPTVALVRADNQRRQAALVGSLGGALIEDDESLPFTLTALARDPDRRADLSTEAAALVDGLGAHRLADHVLSDVARHRAFGHAGIELRTALDEDAEMLFELRNDPSAYAFYRTPAAVSRDEHASWLERTLSGEGSKLLIVERGGEAVGQVRLDREGEHAGAPVELNISLGESARGAGIGRRAIRAGCLFAWIRMGAGPILASVHPGNEASRRAFAAIGFDLGGRDDAGFDLLSLARSSFSWTAP